MKTLEEIRNECRNENHAARRLLSAGFRLEGWDMNTGRRIVAHGISPRQIVQRQRLALFCHTFPHSL